MKKTRPAQKRFAVCVRNDDYMASLEVRKIYRVIPDAEAARYRQIRVIDESGEDYLYPESLFLPISLPSRTQKALSRAA